MPSPPCPAATVIVASSMNCMARLRGQSKKSRVYDSSRRVNGGRIRARRDDVDVFSLLRAGERDVSADHGEDRMVAADSDALTGVELGAALADEDVARYDELAAEALDAETLGVRVTPVARGARALLGCE